MTKYTVMCAAYYSKNYDLKSEPKVPSEINKYPLLAYARPVIDIFQVVGY